MKNKLISLILILFLLNGCVGASSVGVFGSGVSVAIDPRTVGTQIDDGIMDKNLDAKLLLMNKNYLLSVKTQVLDGRIFITGKVDDPEEKLKITKLAWEVQGTRSVKNDIKIKEEFNFKQSAKDVLITSQLKTAIAPKGSIIFTTGQTWHDIGHNLDGKRRWGIIAYYSRWWIKPTFDFVSNCSKKTFSMCNNIQKELLGFNSTPPSKWSIKKHKTLRPKTKIPKKYSDLKTSEFKSYKLLSKIITISAPASS